MFKYKLLRETPSVSLRLLLKLVPMCLIDDKSTLLQILVWHCSGTRASSEAMLSKSLSLYIYSTYMCGPGPWDPYQYKDVVLRYGVSHYKAETDVRTSQLYNGKRHTLRRRLYIDTAPSVTFKAYDFHSRKCCCYLQIREKLI